MNNVTMETVASLHSTYGRVKVKPFNFSREVQLSAEPIQQKQGLRENHSTSARVKNEVP